MNLQEAKKMSLIELKVAQYRVMLLKLYIEFGFYDHEEFEQRVYEYRFRLEQENKK